MEEESKQPLKIPKNQPISDPHLSFMTTLVNDSNLRTRESLISNTTHPTIIEILKISMIVGAWSMVKRSTVQSLAVSIEKATAKLMPSIYRTKTSLYLYPILLSISLELELIFVS